MPAKSRSPSPPGRSQRPTPPAKRTSPPISRSLFAQKKQRLPGQCPGTSSDFEGHPKKISRRRRLNQKIGLDRFDLELEAEVTKEIAVRDHRRTLGMNPDRAAKAAFDSGHVLDVIDVPMGKKEEACSSIPSPTSQSQAPSGASKRIQPSGASSA